MRRKLDYKAVLSLCMQGMGGAAIARYLGYSRSGVQHILTRSKRSVEIDHALAARLYAEGLPVKEIMRRCRCSEDTVRRARKAAGIPARQPKKACGWQGFERRQAA